MSEITSHVTARRISAAAAALLAALDASSAPAPDRLDDQTESAAGPTTLSFHGLPCST